MNSLGPKDRTSSAGRDICDVKTFRRVQIGPPLDTTRDSALIQASHPFSDDEQPGVVDAAAQLVFVLGGNNTDAAGSFGVMVAYSILVDIGTFAGKTGRE